MTAYLITTGTVFGLITLAHIWRIAQEGSRLLTEPGYLLLTIAAAGLSAWAWVLLRKQRIRG
jgi:tellurite resistance protein TehA-like permease